MNLQVNSMTVFSNTGAMEGDRHFLDLSVSMSRPQIERAIVTLLGSLPQEQAYHLLRTEFSELFTIESIE